jgi:HEPN domain-containing protein
MPKILSRQNQLLHLVAQHGADARVLFKSGRYNGCVYMAGYAVECALKAATCRQLKQRRLHALLACHDLELLVGRTSKANVPHIMLWERLRHDQRALSAFELVHSIWSPEMRYETAPIDRETARRVLDAVALLTEWLRRQYT